MSFPAKVRLEIFTRDMGFCAKCGVDCKLVARIVHRLEEGCGFTSRAGVFWPMLSLAAVFYRYMIGWTKYPSSYWEADHILPTASGGEDTMENARTLCQPCHRGETSEYAGLLAAGRKTTVKTEYGQVVPRKKKRSRWPQGRKIPKGRPLR